jgi:hypothetical protein
MPQIIQARNDFYSTKDKTIVKIKYREYEDENEFHAVGSVSIGRRQIEDFVGSGETLQIAATELINKMVLWMEQRIGSSDYGIKASVKAIETEKEHILNGDQSNLFK